MTPTPEALPRPLVLTCEGPLLDELLQVCAAAGVTPDVAHDIGAARRHWSAASAVLVGADLLPELSGAALPRRDALSVVAMDPVDDRAWPSALQVGAERVLHLPNARDALVGLLGDYAEASRDGIVVAVVGGCGGAGASVVAASLGMVAARRAPTLLVDADPWGPGVDSTLGVEDLTGARWHDLTRAHGRLGAASLRDALPCSGSLSFLTWDRAQVVLPAPRTVAMVLTAGRRAYDLVVVDLPRQLTSGAEEAVVHADLTLLVVPALVRATAAAAQVRERLRDLGADSGVVVRGTNGGSVEAEVVAESLGAPLLARIGVERGLDAALDHGLGPLARRRGPLRAGCLDLLERIGPGRTAAA